MFIIRRSYNKPSSLDNLPSPCIVNLSKSLWELSVVEQKQSWRQRDHRWLDCRWPTWHPIRTSLRASQDVVRGLSMDWPSPSKAEWTGGRTQALERVVWVICCGAKGLKLPSNVFKTWSSLSTCPSCGSCWRHPWGPSRSVWLISALTGDLLLMLQLTKEEHSESFPYAALNAVCFQLSLPYFCIDVLMCLRTTSWIDLGQLRFAFVALEKHVNISKIFSWQWKDMTRTGAADLRARSESKLPLSRLSLIHSLR